jgi:site-specific recombinase XerD
VDLHYLSDFSIKMKKEADMQRHRSHVSNPNYDIGCHPCDLRDRIDTETFLNGSIQPTFTQSIQTVIISQRRHERRKVLDRLLIQAAAAGDLPGLEHLSQYLSEKYRRNCSPSTLRLTATSLILFLSFCRRSSGKQQIEQVDRQDLEAFVEHEQDRGLKPNTVRTRLCCVYAFIRFLIRKKVLDYELLERKIRLKLPDRLPRAMEADHVKRLLSAVDHIRDRALIMLLLRTGMRIGELLNTTVEDVDLNDQKIVIYKADKTGVGRVVYFSDDALEALMAWLRIRCPQQWRLFYAQGRSSLSYESSRMLFKKYLQKAGLQYHGYTLHCLRHTFATELLNARMPLECLRVLLGHTNLEVTRRYARLTDKTREEEYFNAMTKVVNYDFGEYDQCDD